jgi:hypothetical protein
MQDTSLRPICFGIDKVVTPEIGKTVGAEKFKRYEYALYLCAQLSRIVYCDTGIAWHVIGESLGLNNDEVNNFITKYDKQFADKRRTPVTSQPGEPGTDRPAESYSLKVSDGTDPYGVYISSPSDCTALVVTGKALKPNPSSPFLPTDIFITFKGSSTIKNFKHDIMSQFSATELKSIAGEVMKNNVGNVPTAFAKPIMKVWDALMKALDKFATDNCRLFISGHSLGGASATLFGFILAEAKDADTVPILKKIKSIHIVTFGAPTCVSDPARNNFNRHLDSGRLTFDRVVNQAVAARSAATQAVVGGVLGPNDVIPNIPVGFAHPGFRPLATEFRPEANGRPYQMINVRAYYGVPSKTNGRETTTWPFQGTMTEPTQPSVDPASVAEELQSVKVPEVPEGASSSDPVPALTGGGGGKTEYAIQTKTHLPNFLSVLGSKWARGFAHAEYLGMFYMGGFRLLGMKNPASKALAYFILNSAGVKITYLPTTDTERVNSANNPPVQNQSAAPPPKKRGLFFGGKLKRTKRAKRSKQSKRATRRRR